jgi:hypothetical protein
VGIKILVAFSSSRLLRISMTIIKFPLPYLAQTRNTCDCKSNFLNDQKLGSHDDKEMGISMASG